MGWLGFSGRCNRQQYWVMAVLLLASPLAASLLHLPGEGGEVFWLILYGRRLHDIGRTLWLAVGVVLLSLLPMLLAGAIEGPSFRHVILRQGVDEEGHRSLAYLGAIAGAFLIQHSFTVWLGLRKGDEGQNRFGPPQKVWGSAKPAITSGALSIWEARLWEDDELLAPPVAPPPPAGPTGPTRYASGAVRPAFGRRPSS